MSSIGTTSKLAPRRSIPAVALVLLLVLGPFGSLAIAAPVTIVRESIHPWLSMGHAVPMASQVCSTTSLCVSTVRAAYGFGPLIANSTMNGTGQTVVIVDACGDAGIAADLKTFDTANSLPAPKLTIYQPQGKPCSNPGGWGLETALDVEWAHAMAPGASIALVEAKSASNTNLFGAWTYTLNHKLGNAISNSWGGGGGCSSTTKTILNTATTNHVTVLASAGDSGAWGAGTSFTIQSPADCQTVVAVGGTSLSVTSVAGAYSSESAWSGGGGGYVTGTSEPTFQTNANITDSFSDLGKPDVSAVADPNTGVWVYEKAAGGWFVVGGTSVACPIWAGFLTDINSWRAANTFNALGNVDPFLYTSIYGHNGALSNYTKGFHDITSGSNGWSAATGWDAATGLGSFRAYSLANLLANAASA